MEIFLGQHNNTGMKVLKKIFILAPFLILMVNCYYCFALESIISNEAKMLLANIGSFGLLTNITFLYLAIRWNFCLFNRCAVFGLILLNLLNIFYFSTDWLSSEAYYQFYDRLIIGVFSTLSIIFFLMESNSQFIIKNKMQKTIESIKLLFYGIFSWLNIDTEIFLILMAFMVADSLIGALKYVRLGHKFSFKKLLWGFVLKLLFLAVPLFVSLLGKGLGYDFTISVEIVMKVLIVSEAYSVFGNILAAKNKKEVDKMDIISMLLISLRKGLKSIVSKYLHKLEQTADCEINVDKEKGLEPNKAKIKK